MMKKLVVLVLVLAMGSMASAGLMLSADRTVANVGESVLVGIDAVAQPANVAVFILLNGVGVLDVTGAQNAVVPGPDGLMKLIDLGVAPADLGADDAIYAELVKLVIPSPILDGNLVSGVKLSSLVEGTALLKIMDTESGHIFSELAVTFVPEPASMILLGLGGLFLRRRK
jgi:hypothetical protein